MRIRRTARPRASGVRGADQAADRVVLEGADGAAGVAGADRVRAAEIAETSNHSAGAAHDAQPLFFLERDGRAIMEWVYLLERIACRHAPSECVK